MCSSMACMWRFPPSTTSSGETFCPHFCMDQAFESLTGGLKLNHNASGMRVGNLSNHDTVMPKVGDNFNKEYSTKISFGHAVAGPVGDADCSLRNSRRVRTCVWNSSLVTSH